MLLIFINFWMEKSKLIQILSRLSAWEFRGFQDFVHSPFFNRHEAVKKLLHILAIAYPDFESVNLNKKIIFKNLFPEETYHTQKLYDVTSYLTKLLADYLGILHFQANDFDKNFHLLQSLRKRRLDKYFNQQFRSVRKNLPPPKSSQHYHQQFLLEEDRLHLLAAQKQRSPKEEMSQMIKSLDISYLIQRLRYGCAMANRRDVLDADYDLEWVNQLINFIQSRLEEFQKIPLLMVYVHLFQLIATENGERHFFDAWKRLREDHQALPSDGLRELYAYLMNYCIKQINIGEIKWHPHLFDLYEWQLVKEILFEDKVLSPWDFKNIVSLGLQMNKSDWTMQFIETYKNQISENHRENAYTYNLAVWYHHMGEYGATLKLLRYINFEDVFYELGSKTILLKIYYETEAYESLFYLLDAFAAFLKRNKQVSTYQKELYHNLISFVRKLAKIRLKMSVSSKLIKPSNLTALSNQIQRKKKTAQLDWLLNQIQELKKYLF